MKKELLERSKTQSFASGTPGQWRRGRRRGEALTTQQQQLVPLPPPVCSASPGTCRTCFGYRREECPASPSPRAAPPQSRPSLPRQLHPQVPGCRVGQGVQVGGPVFCCRQADLRDELGQDAGHRTGAARRRFRARLTPAWVPMTHGPSPSRFFVLRSASASVDPSL